MDPKEPKLRKRKNDKKKKKDYNIYSSKHVRKTLENKVNSEKKNIKKGITL